MAVALESHFRELKQVYMPPTSLSSSYANRWCRLKLYVGTWASRIFISCLCIKQGIRYCSRYVYLYMWMCVCTYQSFFKKSDISRSVGPSASHLCNRRVWKVRWSAHMGASRQCYEFHSILGRSGIDTDRMASIQAGTGDLIGWFSRAPRGCERARDLLPWSTRVIRAGTYSCRDK